MEIDKIEKIIRIFESAKISKLDLEADNIKIKLEKEEIQQPTKVLVEETKQEVIEENNWIKSPLVGTYYAQRSKGSEPFIEVGKHVKKGDVICIIEAMKVMSEIVSDRDGVVLKINAKNEQMVQYDENLVLIGEEK